MSPGVPQGIAGLMRSLYVNCWCCHNAPKHPGVYGLRRRMFNICASLSGISARAARNVDVWFTVISLGSRVFPVVWSMFVSHGNLIKQVLNKFLVWSYVEYEVYFALRNKSFRFLRHAVCKIIEDFLKTSKLQQIYERAFKNCFALCFGFVFMGF